MKTFNIYYIKLVIFPDTDLVIHSISFLFVFLFFTFRSGSLQQATIFRCKTLIYVYVAVVYLGSLFRIYFCTGYFELIRCKIPCLFTLAVKLYPVPFNLVFMKVAYIDHGNKFNYKFNAVLSLLVCDSSYFNHTRSLQVLC